MFINHKVVLLGIPSCISFITGFDSGPSGRVGALRGVATRPGIPLPGVRRFPHCVWLLILWDGNSGRTKRPVSPALMTRARGTKSIPSAGKHRPANPYSGLHAAPAQETAFYKPLTSANMESLELWKLNTNPTFRGPFSPSPSPERLSQQTQPR